MLLCYSPVEDRFAMAIGGEARKHILLGAEVAVVMDEFGNEAERGECVTPSAFVRHH